jgi:hypothetical protein
MAMVSQPIGLSAMADAAPPTIDVGLDRATLISLHNGCRKIVLTNPTIVRAARLSGGSHVILTGKAFGETNMTVLDRDGAVAMKSTIRVQDNVITVYRGQSRRTYYNCAWLCKPGMQAGDSDGNIGAPIRGNGQVNVNPQVNSNPTAGPGGGL